MLCVTVSNAFPCVMFLLADMKQGCGGLAPGHQNSIKGVAIWSQVDKSAQFLPNAVGA